MATLDVEALLDATAQSAADERLKSPDSDRPTGNRDESRDRDSRRDRDRGSDRDHDRRRRDSSDVNGTRSRRGDATDDRGASTPHSEAGSYKSRRRSRSRDYDRRRSRRNRDGDYYRVGRNRSRSSSPRHRRSRGDDRDYRDRRDRRDRDRRDRLRDDDRSEKSRSDQPNEDERDRRTVFVQQLAARLRTRELKEFFETVGPVNEAQIVKDRISQRSKGVGYVEFLKEESVQQAMQLTGQKLLGIPIIVQLTEAEKNRQQPRPAAEAPAVQTHTVPLNRLYVGNIHFNVTEQDLQAVFEPFGALEFVQLQKDETGRSRGYGFVQYKQVNDAKEALEKMNGFDLAGRPIRVGLGNDKFNHDNSNNSAHRSSGHHQANFQGSAFSGAGGRGANAPNFDRAGGRDSDKTGGASALDDTDVAGVNFNNYSRDLLMRKLARTDEASSPTTATNDRQTLKPKVEVKSLPAKVNMTNMASRCVVLHNMFDPEKEKGDSWIKELEDDVRQEAEEKYGHVVHIAVDPDSKGDIYVKFDKVQGGEKAAQGLNGRFYDGNTITVSYVVDAIYSSLFSRTRAI